MLQWKRSILSGVTAVLGFSFLFNVNAWDNNLARTPPMGWNSWNKFGGNINEAQIKEIADAMVSSGLKDAGYVYLNLDDNWMASSRDGSGNLQGDPTRFPKGMKELGDYIHSKGLKFGIYGDHGSKTCMGVENSGSYGKEAQDAKTFASWGVDYLKYDNCNIVAGSDQQTDYQNMQKGLADCGRPIVFSICMWRYQSWMPATGNLWRIADDITDKWDNGNGYFHGIINCVDLNADYADNAKPGAWNDPDMLEIGNGGCTTEEYRTQMTMWCIMASPLILGNDIRTMSQTIKDIVLNKEAIAVNQDSAGIQGKRIKAVNGLEVWCKPLGSANGNTKAVALLNRNGSAANITLNFADIGMSDSLTVRDLWAKTDRGRFTGSYTMNVPSHGAGFLKISGEPPKPLSAFDTIHAENYSIQSGTQTETCPEGGQAIGYIENGDYAVYNLQFGENATAFEVRVSSDNTNGGNIEIRLDSLNGTLAGTCAVPLTGSWGTYSTRKCAVTEISGDHKIYLKFTGESSYLLNINWFRFTKDITSIKSVTYQPGTQGMKTVVSKGEIICTPMNSFTTYTISVFLPDGQLVKRLNNISGTIAIPTNHKGVYIINISCHGSTVSRKISLYK